MITCVSMPSRRIRKPFVEIVLPYGRVPLARSALEHLGSPDVVHQDVDVAVSIADAIREALYVDRVEVIDRDRDAVSTKPGDQFGRLFNGFWPVVVRARRAKRRVCSARYR